MNIAVLGSNCKFSSDLAVQLNHLKKTSLVYRYDALADFKKEIPLYKSLLTTVCSKKSSEQPESEKLKKTTVFGEYIGDVETLFLDIPDEKETKKRENFETLEFIFKALDVKIDNVPTYSTQCIIKKLKDSKKIPEIYTSGVLNIINIYSGILNVSMLTKLLDNDPLTIIIKVKGQRGFLPCNITEDDLQEITKKNLQTIIVETLSVGDLLKDTFFISTFNLNNKEYKKEQETKPSKAVDITQGILPYILMQQELPLLEMAA